MFAPLHFVFRPLTLSFRFAADVEAELLSQAEQMLSPGSGQDPEEAAERAAAAAGGAVQRMQAKLLAGAAQHDPAAMVLGILLLVLVSAELQCSLVL